MFQANPGYKWSEPQPYWHHTSSLPNYSQIIWAEEQPSLHQVLHISYKVGRRKDNDQGYAQ